MNRRQLEYFEAVADHEGFMAAARALYVAQPSLSQSIKSFEDELGVSLFHRLPSGVRLTSAGKALLGPARRTLRSFDKARWAVDAVCALEGGSIAIAAVPILAADPLARYVGRFRAVYPGVQVHLADPGNGDVLELLRSGESEIGVTITPFTARDVDAFDLGEDPLYVVLPPNWPVSTGSNLRGEDLEALPFVVVSSTKAMLLRVMDGIDTRPTIAVETAHRDAVLPLVMQGAGVALMPAAAAWQAADLGAIVCPTEPALSRCVVIGYRKVDLSPAAAAFIDLVKSMGPTAELPEDAQLAVGGAVGG